MSEVTDFSDTAESTLELAKETLLGDLMNVVLEEIKAAPDVWQKMSESHQTLVIERIQNRCHSAVNQVVSIVATNGNTDYAMCDVESVTFKDGVKAVLKMPIRTEGAHALADCEGRKVMVVMPDPEEFGNTDSAPTPDPDQPDLINGDQNSGDDQDPLYAEAVDFVKEKGTAMISSVQRKLRIGYNRAARMIEQMESDGIVSAMDDTGTRVVYQGDSAA